MHHLYFLHMHIHTFSDLQHHIFEVQCTYVYGSIYMAFMIVYTTWTYIVYMDMYMALCTLHGHTLYTWTCKYMALCTLHGHTCTVSACWVYYHMSLSEREYYVNVHGNFAYLAQDDISRARIWRSMFGRLVPAMAHSATCIYVCMDI